MSYRDGRRLQPTPSKTIGRASAGLVAEHQPASVRPLVQQTVQLQRRHDLRYVQTSGLFRRLHGDRLQPRDLGVVGAGEARHHQPHPPRAQFGGLLDDGLQAGPFDQGDDQLQLRRGCLRAGYLAKPKGAAALAGSASARARPPLAVAAVEHRDLVALAQPRMTRCADSGPVPPSDERSAPVARSLERKVVSWPFSSAPAYGSSGRRMHRASEPSMSQGTLQDPAHRPAGGAGPRYTSNGRWNCRQKVAIVFEAATAPARTARSSGSPNAPGRLATPGSSPCPSPPAARGARGVVVPALCPPSAGQRRDRDLQPLLLYNRRRGRAGDAFLDRRESRRTFLCTMRPPSSAC